MLQMRFKCLVVAVLAGILGSACQQSSIREDPDPPAELTLDKARALVAQFETAHLAMAEQGAFVDKNGTALFSYAHPIFWAPFSVVGNGR